MQKITKAILASAGMAIAILAPTNPSLAQDQLYNIRARHSDFCLNVLDDGRENGDNVVQAADCGVGSSQWQIIPASRGYYYLRARNSGQCLNVLNSGYRNGDNVVQGYECRADNFQWKLISADGDYNYLQAKHSGQCLNVLNSGYSNGDNVVQGEECRADSFQWNVVPVSNSYAEPHNSRYEDRDYQRPRREREYR